jgi:sigma-B regulation protein RsbU (phosphoserine phosphatase)
VARLFGTLDAPWRQYLLLGLTYTINVPMMLFAVQVLGPGWRNVRRHLLNVDAIFAAVAIIGMAITRWPRWAEMANNVLVLSTLPAIGVALIEQRAIRTRAMTWLRSGVLIAAVFVLAQNLRGMNYIRFWPEDIEYVGFICFAISLAYAVGERFLESESRLAAVDRELETARRIQHSILPRDVPRVEGFRLTARYLPMTAVGGDFYDFYVPASGGSVGVLVADVSGHGVPAALIASMIKVAGSSHREAIDQPGRLLTLMNRTLDGELGGQFATAMSVHLDRHAGVAAFAGAGHPPMLHWRLGARELVSLASTGIMLGPFPAAEYETQRQPIAPGDRFVIYTDGLLEATDAADPNRMFGDERFPALLREHADRSGEELADLILRELARWSGRSSAFADDVTLVIVDVV